MDFQELLTAIAKFSDRKRETRNARTKRLELENTTTLILKKKTPSKSLRTCSAIRMYGIPGEIMVKITYRLEGLNLSTTNFSSCTKINFCWLPPYHTKKTQVKLPNHVFIIKLNFCTNRK